MMSVTCTNIAIVQVQLVVNSCTEQVPSPTTAKYFSGFSVGFCMNEEKVICYQLELEK